MRVVGIIQVRFGSKRLPGKAVRPLMGRPMMLHTIERASAAGFDDLWVATSANDKDDEVASLAKNAGCHVYRGSEHDVVMRMYETALMAKADVIVRVTGDCPLWAPDVGRRVVDAYLAKGNEFTSNDTWISGYPDGLDTEVFSLEMLRQANVHARDEQREHVTMWMRKHYVQQIIWSDEDWRQARWHRNDWRPIKLSVDTLEDFEHASNVMANVPAFKYDWIYTRDAVKRLIER